MAELENIALSRPAAGVLVAKLNRPTKLNALTFGMFAELESLAASVQADNSVRALVLTGEGRSFCAGLDLADAGTLPDMTADEMLTQQKTWGDGIMSLARIDKPVIAAVNGAAAGAGFSLALAADMRVATPETRFNAAFVRIGLSGGDCGSSWTLPRVVGMGIAAEILMTGRFVGADEALRIGLVNRVVETDRLLDEAVELASSITLNSPFGVGLTKAVLRQNIDSPSIDAALEVENRNQVLAAQSPQMQEALTAFLEKRAPDFSAWTTESELVRQS